MQTVPFGSFDGGGGLEVVFTPPVSAVGLFLGDVQFPGSTLTVLNADGQTLASLDLVDQLGPSALQWKFLGVVSTDGDIARIRLAFASNDYVAVDDLEFARVQITTLTRSGTPVPGGTGVFTGFPQSPVMSTTSTAFLGLGSAGEVGVYASVIPSTPTVPPNPTKVADLTTAIPGGTGTFIGFTQLAASGTRTSFIATGSGQEGIYSCDSAAPTDPCQPIADLTTLIAGGTGTFTGFTQLAASGTRTSFIGTGSGQEGVYSCDGASPVDPCRPIADLTTLIAGGTGTFTGFTQLAASGTRTSFIGTGSGQEGVYSCDGAIPTDPCQPIADLTTLIAGGTGTFTAFTQLAASGTRTSFIASGLGQQGVYLSDATNVAVPPNPVKVADLATAIPGGTGNFTSFSAVSASLGHTAFLGHGSDDQAGIYLASTLTKVIAVGDTLAGQVVTELRLGQFALDGQRLGFAATFADGSQGVFVFTVPPSAVDTCTITTVLDNFNRADGSVGTNWRGATGTSFYRIAGNRLDVQVGGPIYWNPTAFGTNQAAFVTLKTVAPNSPSQGVLLKVQSGSVPNAGAISVVYDATAKAVRVSTIRLGALAWTPYGNTAVLFTNGDKLGACAKANGEVRVYKNDTLVKTVTLSPADQRFFNAKGGKVGVWSLLAPQAFLDNFGGATIAP